MNRSAYSLENSTLRIEELVNYAKELGYTSVALTDHNVMHGVFKFNDACKKANIKPIFGMETDVFMDEKTVPFLLLAKDAKGLTELFKLSTLQSVKDMGISLSDLKEHSSHCVIILYGESGPFDRYLLEGATDSILSGLRFFKNEFPEFYAAVSYEDSSLWKGKNPLWKRCCKNLGITTVALNKNYYLRKEDDSLQRILQAIQTEKTLQDESLLKISGRYVRSIKEMEELYDAEDLEATDTIASLCNVNMDDLPTTSLPIYPVPQGFTQAQYLTKLCLVGLEKRGITKENSTYRHRLKYELDVIIRMHFENYFLIVYDFIKYARKAGILVGPGRGSACGSLVAYVLGITMIDPIRYHLLFERFLNPERITMPDIDTDIPDNRRQEVINYVIEKYGYHHVSNIITFNTFGPRQVIRDVGKVLNLGAYEIDTVLKLIPNIPGMTLTKALQDSPRLQTIVKAEKKYEMLFFYARRLEGLPRHQSVHAAGIVLSEKPLEDIIPLNEQPEIIATSAIEANYLEPLGLIKMDFLGLRNLSMIDEIVKKIQEKEPAFSLTSVSLEDLETYAVFQSADTNGIFQFESEGMKGLLRKMKPRNYEDLIAALALFRPASKDSIGMYLENRAHPETIQYPLDSLKEILSESYGVMIYQEQGMLTAQKAAGFTLGKADVLRKAMSKKKEKDLLALKEDFIRGCLKNGISETKAEELFELVHKFGGYGFNKSHAAAYAKIAYDTAYLKAHYPTIFYGSLMDHNLGNSAKCVQYIYECKSKGITVKAPDIETSNTTCVLGNREILLPLSMIKGIGIRTIEAIEKERQQKPFEDYFDCIARLNACKLARDEIEHLIHAGAMDCFKETRTTLLYNLDAALSYGELIQVGDGKQCVLDESLLSKPVIMKCKEETEAISAKEREVLGFTLGKDPIETYRAKADIHVPLLAKAKEQLGLTSVFVRVESIKNHRTKKGDMMAFLKVCDESAQTDVTVLPSLFQKTQNILRKGNYLWIDGKMEQDGKILANQIKEVQPV